MSDDTVDELHRKEARYAELVHSTGYLHSRFLADAWCAAFVWKKTKEFQYPITNDVLRKIERNPHDCAIWMRGEIQRLREQYQFFHWQLAFPEVFYVPGKGEIAENKHAGWSGGFDLILGNPPWERVNLKEQEWFAERRPEIAHARNAAERKHLIRRLTSEYPTLSDAFADAVRRSEGESHLLRTTGIYPLCGRGDINLYAVFAEGMRLHLNSAGRVGAVLPSGIATDETTKHFFQALVDTCSLVSLFDFENRAGLFAVVDSRMKFCLLTVGSGLQKAADAGEFIFYAHTVDDLRDSNRRFLLDANDIARLNPNSKTCPIFRTRRDAEIAKATYATLPVFVRENDPHGNPWQVHLTRMLHMADDSHLFHTRIKLEEGEAKLEGNRFCADSAAFLPLYEAKMTGAFDHRAADVILSETATIRQGQPDSLSMEDHQNPNRLAFPRYWVSSSMVDAFLRQRERSSLLSFTDVTSPTNERTMIATVLPRVAVGHTKPLIFSEQRISLQCCLFASLNSFAFDYFARQKLGGIHFTYFVFHQIPIPVPSTYAGRCQWSDGTGTVADWLLPRVLELTFTAWDLEPFARDCGWFGPPFVWDETRRFQLRCELDAAFFHLYGLNREDTAYILDTFPIVRRKDEERNEGRYVTKLRILELYDGMQAAISSHQRYKPSLAPVAASFRACHPPKLPQTARAKLASAEKYLVVFFDSFTRHAREEASLELLDAVFHLLRHRENHKAEIAANLGHEAQTWLSGFNDSLPNDAFLPFLKRLESDGWITIDRNDGKIEVTTQFPEVPFDEWRYYDVAAALHVIAKRPEVIAMVTSEKGASLSKREFAKAG